MYGSRFSFRLINDGFLHVANPSASIALPVRAESATTRHMDSGPDHKASVAQNDEEKLSLMSLPVEIKRHIMKFLLQGEQVYASTFPDTCYKSYRFQTAILRTCKSLHEIGMDIFSQNNFILVSTNDMEMYDEMLEHDVCVWKRKILSFKRYHLRLHIIASGIGSKNIKRSFLLCSSDLSKFVAVCRMETFVSDPKFDLKLEMKGLQGTSTPLSLKQQHQILAPFSKLHARGQHCVVEGLVEADLAINLRNSITSPIYWARAELRSHFELIRYKQQLADRAYAKRDFTQACKLYRCAMMFSLSTNYISRVASVLQENEVIAAHQILGNLIQMNSERAIIWYAMSLTQAGGEYADEAWGILQNLYNDTTEEETMEAEAKSEYLRIRGLASLLQGKEKQAQSYFESDGKIQPLSVSSSICLREVRAFTRTAATSNYLTTLTKTARRMAEALIATPILLPVEIGIASVAALDQELHDLKMLGYCGDWLESQVRQMSDRCVRNGRVECGTFSVEPRTKVITPLLLGIKICKAEGVQPADVEIGQTVIPSDLDQTLFPLSEGFERSIERGFWIINSSNDFQSAFHGTLCRRAGDGGWGTDVTDRQRWILEALDAI